MYMPSIFFLINSVENEKAALRHLYTILLHPLTVQSQGLLFPLLDLPNLSKSDSYRKFLSEIRNTKMAYGTKNLHISLISAFLYIPLHSFLLLFISFLSSFLVIPLYSTFLLFISLHSSWGFLWDLKTS